MKKKIQTIIFNKLYLIVAYVFGISITTLCMKLFNKFMMNNSIDHVIYYWQIPIMICCIWAICIFLHDVINHKLYLTKLQIMLWVMDLAMLYSTYLQGVFQGPIWSPGFMYQAMKFGIVFMFTTTFFSAPFQYSREHFKAAIITLAKLEVCLFTVMNVISIVLFALGYEYVNFFGNTLRIFLEARGTVFSIKPGTRLIGLYPLSTLLGFRNTMTSCLALYLYANHVFPKWVMVTVVAISLFTVIQANCRAALLGFGIIFIFAIKKWIMNGCIIRSKSYRTVCKRYVWPTIVAVCLIFFAKKWSLILEKIEILKSDPYDAINSISSLRWEIWISAIKQGCTKPIIGFGYMLPMDFWSMNPGNCVENAHNILVNLFDWGGLLALIPGTYVLFYVFVHLFRNVGKMISSHVEWLGIMTVCVLIQGMLDVNILGSEVPESALYWVFAGLIVSFDAKQSRWEGLNENKQKTE